MSTIQTTGNSREHDGAGRVRRRHAGRDRSGASPAVDTYIADGAHGPTALPSLPAEYDAGRCAGAPESERQKISRVSVIFYPMATANTLCGGLPPPRKMTDYSVEESRCAVCQQSNCDIQIISCGCLLHTVSYFNLPSVERCFIVLFRPMICRQSARRCQTSHTNCCIEISALYFLTYPPQWRARGHRVRRAATMALIEMAFRVAFCIFGVLARSPLNLPI